MRINESLSAVKNAAGRVFNKKNPSHKQVIGDTTKLSPEVYNRSGERMYFFYLQDDVCSHNPYSFASPHYSVTQHIIWDRYNRALPIHFYSHDNIFHCQPYFEKNFGILIESEAIVPDDYRNVYEMRSVIDSFSGIFTHSYKLLERYPNARFMPGGGVWYGSEIGGGVMNPKSYQKKNKNVSLVASDKVSCDLHSYRKAMAIHYKNSGSVDTYGTFDGGAAIKIADSLTEYRYSIAIENFISPYYFTEKVMNCFASMTIPIYIGATEIEKFFNGDGIIKINKMDFNKLDHIIKKCCKEDYEERVNAVIDNYNRVKKYVCYEDLLFNKYSDFILNN